MSLSLLIFTSLGYVVLLFFVAYFGAKHAEKGGQLINNPYVYALSLAVYCTAWTFFGSVGRATQTGIGFLPIYLGPAIFAPIWILVLRKIILISKAQQITSIADFISSRYGKSTTLGVLVSLIAALGVIPYISIQLKAVAISFETLVPSSNYSFLTLKEQPPFFLDLTFYITVVLMFFTTIFGTRKLAPNEKHEGLIAAVTFESIVKLLAFLAVGFFVVYGVFDGFGDLFEQAMQEERIAQIFSFDAVDINSTNWMWLTLLSMAAIIMLPRQFHMAIVENTNHRFLAKAAWLFPLYLLLINIFVIPIAIGGMLTFPEGNIDADTFVLSIPMAYGHQLLALFVYIGGLSAATGMVIVTVTALSIMISNNIVLPFLLRHALWKGEIETDVNVRILGIRRVIIVIVLILAYGYFHLISLRYSLVSIGLISFSAVAQFAPALIGGLYWKRATAKGAIAALITGFIIWFYTLIIPLTVEQGLLPRHLLTEGFLGYSWLKPQALLGLTTLDDISHAAFWSLLLNTTVFVVVSLYTKQSVLELTQANFFVDHHKYIKGSSGYEVLNRSAKTSDIVLLLERILGKQKAIQVLQSYEQKHTIKLRTSTTADEDLIQYTETQLTGAIGAASAKVIISSISKQAPIVLEEMLNILDQTQEVIQSNKALELKTEELQKTTAKLQQANEQLKELDQLKAEFISTVTHELRTPVTSIKAMAKILFDNKDLPEQKREEFLAIIVNESERIARLVTEVLDLQKAQANQTEWNFESLDLNVITNQAYLGLQQLMEEKQIDHRIELPNTPTNIYGDQDKLIQLFVNLISNAIKFSPPKEGKILIKIHTTSHQAIVSVHDNGLGIPKESQQQVFEKFKQIKTPGLQKPRGTGLGLHISQLIAQKHNGQISLQSELGKGSVFSVNLPLLKKDI